VSATFGRRKQWLATLLGTPTGIAGVVLMAVLVLLAIIGPPIWGDAAVKSDFLRTLLPPSTSHPLGTNGSGQDNLARVLVGTRLSLLMAAGSVAIAATIGLVSGALLVTVGGRVQRIGATIIDTWLGFPSILLSVLIIAVLEKGRGAIVIAIGFSIAPFFARITLTSAASVVGLDYVAAGRLLGLSRWRIAHRYVLGNIIDSLVVAIFSMFGQCLIAISALTYLGFGGARDGIESWTSIDWGSVLNDSVRNFRDQPASVLGPAIAIAIAGVAFGWFGDALGRSLNPRLTVRSASGRSLRSSRASASGGATANASVNS